MQSWVGCSGWFYWHWKGLFYPAEAPTHRWFRHYTAHFDTVELNAPFYRWPTDATIKTWRRQAPPGFRYAIKVNGLITHEKRFVGTKRLIKQFYRISDVLQEQMGCYLFQFPPSFHFSLARLRKVLEQLDPAQKNVLEFRHKTWWNKAVYRACEKAGVTFCTVSGPRLPDALVQTSELLYIRFHGIKQWYRYDYSPEELMAWAEKIKATRALEAWIYFNNDRNAFAIKNAQMLRGLLSSDITEGALLENTV